MNTIKISGIKVRGEIELDSKSYRKIKEQVKKDYINELKGYGYNVQELYQIISESVEPIEYLEILSLCTDKMLDKAKESDTINTHLISVLEAINAILNIKED